jgi:hypothetical protein
MTALTQQPESQIARPLIILIPLIQKDLAEANEAGEPYYCAAGEKMLEAKQQMKHGEFGPWVKRHFAITMRQAQRYMGFAKTTANAQMRHTSRFSNFNEYVRKQPGQGKTVVKRDWHEDVKQNIERAKREAERIREAELTRQQEREAEQKLALRLIEIGYKVLAKELHPDKGGSRDAMARLNRVRDRLKQYM